MNAQTNVNNSGQKIRTVDITVTAAMAALVFLGTYIFKIPTISGYVHLGDCMIILTVALFGMKKGAVAGAIGGGLSDFIGGYFYWVVPTLLIKCMWALVMGLIMHKILKDRKGAFLIGAVSGGVLHIIAYTLVRAALYGGRTWFCYLYATEKIRRSRPLIWYARLKNVRFTGYMPFREERAYFLKEKIRFVLRGQG